MRFGLEALRRTQKIRLTSNALRALPLEIFIKPSTAINLRKLLL
jgi:hypothetical protein